MSNATFLAIDHVQLAMPACGEARAREFYVRLLGMVEIEKPEELRARGGAWFGSGIVQIHLGVEADFGPAKKAHPALRCSDYDGLLATLREAGIVAVGDSSAVPDGSRHAYVEDPFGNRIELIDVAR
ncbi:MAG TPA: VOC family protein [Candidatus Tumulicola sp.]